MTEVKPINDDTRLPLSAYPVALCIRAVEMAMQDCDAATPGPWKGCAVSAWQDARHVVSDEATDRFAVLARAAFRASLEHLASWLSLADRDSDALHAEARAVAPLIAHYDATRPGWRTE